MSSPMIMRMVESSSSSTQAGQSNLQQSYISKREEGPPFSVRLLESCELPAPDTPYSLTADLSALLPATYRDHDDSIWSPAEDVPTFIDRELDLTRLARVHGWLKVAGRPMMPRPLNYQQFHGREITITEKMDMHLVWATGRIFIKPLPRFLMEPWFWDTYLSGAGAGKGDHEACRVRRGRALGFLKSYAALIAYESDFRIAQDKRLIPLEVRWSDWRTFVEQVLGALSREGVEVDQRFRYGELRLSRLNKIHYLWATPLQGYTSRWNQYGSFFADNFIWMASATVLLAVVLNAMQVGLETEPLSNNETFQRVAYGFSVFTLVGLASAVGVVLLQFCYFFIDNVFATIRYARRRLAGRGGRGGV